MILFLTYGKRFGIVEIVALKANQNDDFNPFYALERILEKDNDPFKALAILERFERQVCRQKPT